jgi:LmbE family N-acetylglucosaminyl deacetylase
MPRFDADYVPRSALTIFAHPDDAEFSVAGTIARWAAAGCEVTFLLCTSGNVGTHDPAFTRETLARTRSEEQQAAAALLGVQAVVELGYDDCQLQPTLELRRRLVREIRRIRPEVVICGDPRAWFYDNVYINHPDHRAAATAALEAVFPCAEMPLVWPEEGPGHKVAAVYVSGTEAPNIWIDISDTMERKLASLKCHASQMGDWDPSEMVREWAKREAEVARQAVADNTDEPSPEPGDRPVPTYVEAFRVMKLTDEEAPPER